MAAHTITAHRPAGTDLSPTGSRPARARWRPPPPGATLRLTVTLVLVTALALIALPRLAELVIFPTAPPVATGPTTTTATAAHALMTAPRPGPRPDRGLGPTLPQPIAPAVTTPGQPAAPTGRITLHHGDTLWAIARSSHTRVATLQQLNSLGDDTRIYAGHTLLIPAAAPSTAPSTALSAAPGHGAAYRTPTSPVQVSHGTSHAGPVSLLVASMFGPQASCAAAIIARESGGNVHATNPASGAYGLPQALPAAKMAAFGADWQDNPATQLAWMRAYVTDRYGGACPAWTFWQAHSWY